MRLRQAGAVALTLTLLVSASSLAGTPTPILPTEDILFRPVAVFSVATPAPTPLVETIYDYHGKPTPSTPERPAVPDAQPKALLRVTSSGEQRILGNGRLSGLASWYCKAGRSICHNAYPDTTGFDAYAAAGPGLRAAICGDQSCTSWRGKTVTVNGIPVKLVDWCQCYWKQPHEKLIDLYWDVFNVTGGNVIIGW
jgi:hypothetical protein